MKKTITQSAQEALEAANIASEVAAKAVQVAQDVVDKATETAAKVAAIPNNSQDHDLIIKLDTKMDALKEDIQKLNDGVSKQIGDHETRIKVLEKGMTKLMAYGTAVIFAVGVVEFFVQKFWR